MVCSRCQPQSPRASVIGGLDYQRLLHCVESKHCRSLTSVWHDDLSSNPLWLLRLAEPDPPWNGSISKNVLVVYPVYYRAGRMTVSMPPAFVLPLSFVKSNTWFTVSTRDVPHACTVFKKEAWLGVRSVDVNSSAAARIYEINVSNA